MADVQVFEPELLENFTDRGWRAAFAGRTGIVCDVDGSAFGLTLPAEGSTVEIGSPTVPSRLVVDGFGLEVPTATTQSLSVPASVGGGTAGRTDLIVGRLTTGPMNLRLHRIPGTEGSTTLPSASFNPTGTRDLVLYRIRRREGEGLPQAIVTDLRPRIGLHHLVLPGAPLPANATLGDRATRDGIAWRLDFDGATPDWIQETWPRVVLTSAAVREVNGAGYGIRSQSRLIRDNSDRSMNLVMFRTGSAWNPQTDGEAPLARLLAADRPNVAEVPLRGFARRPGGIYYEIGGRVDLDGWVTWHWLGAEGRMPTDTELTLAGEWTRE